jgi:hypothetical protein
MQRPMWPAALLFGAVVACGDGRRAASDAAGAADSATARVSPGRDARADAALERSARDWVGFLRAELPFDASALADTVELRVAPEGGGAVTRVGRDALRDRSAWTVAGPERSFPLVPPAGFSTVSTRVGRHFDCQEQDLATRAPDLAARPHVGVRLQPDGARSCLQSWNATFIFDTAAGRPRLTAVVYDQWEW